ncbi:hypothetical protein [Rhodococcus oryzae]|jgi:hypothetical protein|uniref:Rv0361 family membrane protein n=1 Tax=Rhodococcus oryzae TaxID=2571143 RepID=UPI0037B8ACAF
MSMDEPESVAPIPTDEQIRTLIANAFTALGAGDYGTFDALQCRENRSAETPSPDAPGVEALRGVKLDNVDGITVNGDTATAVTHHHVDSAPDKPLSETVALRMEDGHWTLC